MKNILFIIFLLPLSFLSSSSKPEVINKGGIEFFKGTWKEAVQKAQQENKPIFLNIYATWCGPCHLLELITFPNNKAGEIYNNSFINVSLNGEGREGALLAAKFKLSAYPTLLYLDKNGNPVLYTEGFLKPRDFIKIGKAALEKINQASSGSPLSD